MRTTLFTTSPLTVLLSLSTLADSTFATHIPRARLQEHRRDLDLAKRQDDRVKISIGTVVSEGTWAGLDGEEGGEDSDDTASKTVPANVTISTASSTSTQSSSGPSSTEYTPTKLRFPKVHRNKDIKSDSYDKLSKAIPEILENANDITTHSWELGCLADTLLEVYNPALSPFEWDAEGCNKDVPWNVLTIAQRSLAGYDWTGSPGSSSKTSNLSNYLDEATSPVPLVPKALIDGAGALGDPVSLVPAVWLLARFAGRGEVWRKLGTRSADDYAWAVGNQLAHLWAGPRDGDGCISQREGHWELWADMGSMVTPSLSFLSMDTGETQYMETAFSQYTFQAAALLDTNTNIYNHITGWDERLWATGNGWMLYGVLRNLASVAETTFSDLVSTHTEKAIDNLTKLFPALFGTLDEQDLIPNYMYQSDPALSHGDTAGTALIVASYYRAITFIPELADDWLTQQAERAFDGVVAKLDDDGWVTHAVDPMGTNGWVVYPDRDLHSPEAQAFVVKMWKARTLAGL